MAPNHNPLPQALQKMEQALDEARADSPEQPTAAAMNAACYPG